MVKGLLSGMDTNHVVRINLPYEFYTHYFI